MIDYEPTRERRKVLLFVVLSFLCLGLPRVITNATAFALFINAFGAARLPYTYLGAALLAPLVGAGYLWLNRHVTFWTLILSALLFDIVALSLTWIGLQTPLASGLIALLAVWVEVEWMITGLVFWGLAERMFTLRDAKRLFGVISAGEPAAIICGGLAVPLLLTVIGTRDLLFVTVAALTGGAGVVLAVRACFKSDLAKGLGDEENSPGLKVVRGFGRYQTYVNVIFMVVLLAEAVHFIVDNAFYDVAETRYLEKDALASFIGMFFLASGVVNLLCNVFVSGWVLRRHSTGAAMLSVPMLIVATGVLAVAAATLLGDGVTFFALVAGTKLIDEAVRNGIYTTGFLTVYQPLPAELRTRAHAAAGSVVEQVAAGLAGIALIGLNFALGFRALELTAFAVLVAIAWAFAAKRLFQRYIEVLRQTIARRRPAAVAVALDDDGSLAVEQHLAADDAALGDPGDVVFSQLTLLFDRTECDARTRGRIALALGRIGSPEALKLLFARLHDHGLDERLAVARALAFGKFVADPVQAKQVWSEIEAAQEIASLLDAGAALVDDGERVELLRIACRDARERERERLFFLLAMVLPRERIVEVAWSHARATEDVRAYAIEVLDTLLPARRKKVVLRLLEETPEPRTRPPATLAAFIERLGAEAPATAWIRCCALYAGDAANVLPPEATLQRWAQSPESALSEVARAILGKSGPGEPRTLAIDKAMILRSVELLSAVPSQFLAAIADVLGQGEIVTREGEMGEKSYVVVDGSLEVTRDGRAIAASD